MITSVIAPNRCALILIDMQADFGATDGAMARMGKDMTKPQAAIRCAARLAGAARKAGIKLVFVRLLTKPSSSQSQALCVEATPGSEFIGPLPQAADLVVTKSRFSAFSGTGLAETLRNWDITTLLLAGLTTECCIQATAWAALDLDFNVVLASDCCAAYDEDLHRNTLKALQLSGAIVTNCADLMDHFF